MSAYKSVSLSEENLKLEGSKIRKIEAFEDLKQMGQRGREYVEQQGMEQADIEQRQMLQERKNQQYQQAKEGQEKVIENLKHKEIQISNWKNLFEKLI